jgi:hypothetical protein
MAFEWAANMKSELLRRLEVLEARMATVVAPVFFRYGWLRRLPKDFSGERHIVSIKTKPTNSPNFEWCEFEERPGPAPLAEDRGFTVYLTE